MDKSLGHSIGIGEALFKSHMPNLSPTPQTRMDVCIQNCFQFQLCIGCGEGELQDIFQKVALFYKGSQKLQKITNTALLYQEFWPGKQLLNKS